MFFHTDAVQAAGKVPIDVKEIRCDLLTLTAQRCMARREQARCMSAREHSLQPMLYGGRHERSRRAGTENLAGIVGLGNAAEIAREGFSDGSVERMAGLRDRLERTVLATVDQVGVNSAGAPRVPNTTNIVFDCLEGEAMVIALDLKGLSRFDRSGVFVGSHRAVARFDRDGVVAGPRASELALQPWQAEHSRRHRLRVAVDSRGRDQAAGFESGVQESRQVSSVVSGFRFTQKLQERLDHWF